MPDQTELSDTDTQIQRLLRGLQQRALLQPGDVARSALEMNLLQQFAALSERLDRTPSASPDAPPSRRVATAMALALHSQPHLAATFGPERGDGTEQVLERGPYPAEAPFVVPNEVAEAALGLSTWELDDLREDIDRRAGRALKRRRALTWLWSHFGLPGARPAPLFRVLFPGRDRFGNLAQILRRGGRLYATLDVPAQPLPALYLGWIGAKDDAATAPLVSFRARYVDHGLKRSLSRGIGAEPGEIDRILDRMVVLIPRSDQIGFLERDQWRVTGLSSLTNLGDDYLGQGRLVDPVEREELEWERWIRAKDGQPSIARPLKSLFDEFALHRAQSMMKQIYAAMLARIEQVDEGEEGFAVEDLDLFDVMSHLRTALTPLVAWGQSDSAAAHVANRLHVPKEKASRLLRDVSVAWENHMEGRWLTAPSPTRRNTIPSLLLAHLLATRRSVLRMALREPDPRWEHRSFSLLFAAHYLAEAPIERLWLGGLSDMPMNGENRLPPPEDIVGCWFWPVWQRLLDASEDETQPTVIP